MIEGGKIRLLLMGWLVSLRWGLIKAEGFNLEDVGGKVENLKIRNNIGYHFLRRVRPITQEHFMSRRIDTTALLQGVDSLKLVADKLKHFCQDIPRQLTRVKDLEIKTSLGKPKVATGQYTFLNSVRSTTFHEAKARCEALGQQLPEIYSSHSMGMLKTYMQ